MSPRDKVLIVVALTAMSWILFFKTVQLILWIFN